MSLYGNILGHSCYLLRLALMGFLPLQLGFFLALGDLGLSSLFVSVVIKLGITKVIVIEDWLYFPSVPDIFVDF